MTTTSQHIHSARNEDKVADRGATLGGPDSFLTVEQAADRLGTPVRFVRRLIAQRRIGFFKIGRYVRISETDLKSFISAAHVEPRVDQEHGHRSAGR